MRPAGALTPLSVLVAAVVAVLGCGGEEEEPTGRSVTVDVDEGVEVVGGEYFFDPETVVAEGGPGRLEITLDNEGSLAHNVRVFDGAVELGGTPTFAGGDARSGTVEVEPGTYRLVCTVADHEELGMVGDLEVR